MLSARVAIIGGGLSGLYAAALLEARGIQDYVLLEARASFGGRILSLSQDFAMSLQEVDSQPVPGRHDLGATWFWPALQPDVLRLVEDLGLETIEQYETGDMLFEQTRADAPLRIDGYRSVPAALRIAGGMGALVDAIRGRLGAAAIVAGCQVRRVRDRSDCIEVEAKDATGKEVTHRVAHVLLAVPPRLAASTIEFAPALPQELMQQWTACGTWMAPHAKYMAVFEQPFWRAQGLSGAARSAVGPMVEIHDASDRAHGALFGFLGIPAQTRHKMPAATLLAHCRAQLVRLFGDAAARPCAEFLKDWASDPYTAVAADGEAGAHHAISLAATASSGDWRTRLIGVASEWSPDFSGYVAGALDAAQRGVATLIAPDSAFTLLH